jgi:Tol biopolymer transport system component
MLVQGAGTWPAQPSSARSAWFIRVPALAVLALPTACGGTDCGADLLAPACGAVVTGDAPPRALVFQSTRNAPQHIYTANADGSDVVRLTTAGRNGLPRWSPDGAQIVFTSWRSGSAEVWVMNADGSGQRRVVAHERPAYMPDWSPDGNRIAFSAERGDGDFDVYVVHADGSSLQRITTSASHWGPRWSPDGSRLAVRWMESSAGCGCIATLPQCPCNGRIATMNPDGTGLHVLPQVGACDAWPEWSPDGTRILFSSYRSPGRGVPARAQLMVMTATGAHARPLTAGTAMDEFSPSWSRSTGRIWFVRAFDIYTVRPDGHDTVRVSAAQAHDMAVHAR